MPNPPLETAQDVLAAGLPEPLRPLARLAFDYWWSWQRGGEELWRAVDPDRWDASGHNPVRLLREAPRQTLERAAQDGALLAELRRLVLALEAVHAAPEAPAPPASADAPIAFLCAEYAVHASLPIYSGGLGVLAGDLLKEASDRRTPLVAVGLLYRRGYFHQRLDPTGLQHEYWTTIAPEQLALEPARDAAGGPLTVQVPIRDRSVEARIWRAQVGRIPLYLLDTDVRRERAHRTGSSPRSSTSATASTGSCSTRSSASAACARSPRSASGQRSTT